MRTLWIGLSLVAWSFTACGSESTTTLDTDVSSEPATSSPSSAQPSLADNTSVPDEAPRGVPLDQVLQPYEAAAVEASDGYWQSYTLVCRTPPVLRGGDWPPPTDSEELVGRGAVIECVPRTDPPADTSGVWLIVLDDAHLKTAVGAALNGALFSTGQRSTASSRVIVTDWPSHHDRPDTNPAASKAPSTMPMTPDAAQNAVSET